MVEFLQASTPIPTLALDPGFGGWNNTPARDLSAPPAQTRLRPALCIRLPLHTDAHNGHLHAQRYAKPNPRSGIQARCLQPTSSDASHRRRTFAILMSLVQKAYAISGTSSRPTRSKLSEDGWRYMLTLVPYNRNSDVQTERMVYTTSFGLEMLSHWACIFSVPVVCHSSPRTPYLFSPIPLSSVFSPTSDSHAHVLSRTCERRRRDGDLLSMFIGDSYGYDYACDLVTAPDRDRTRT